jgi:hypothetical protein
MFKVVCVLNAVLVLPFAVSALVAPDFTFAQFGIDLGTEGAGVARGYGATALGWGIVCAMLRNTADRTVQTAILVASTAFNLAEVALQVPIALSGIASAMIWVTIIAHGVIGALSLYAQSSVRSAAA